MLRCFSDGDKKRVDSVIERGQYAETWDPFNYDAMGGNKPRRAVGVAPRAGQCFLADVGEDTK